MTYCSEAYLREMAKSEDWRDRQRIAENLYIYDELVKELVISENITVIKKYAFYGCTSITKVVFKNTDGWWRSSSASSTSGTDFNKNELLNATTAKQYLISTYVSYYWKYTQP